MLKGFVSDEEKDIVRIPMRTKQLYDDRRTETTAWKLKTDKFIIGCYGNNKSTTSSNIVSYSISENQITVASGSGGCGIGVIVEIENDKTYTLSFDTSKELTGDSSYFGFNLISESGSLGTYVAPPATKVYTFNSGSAKYAYFVFRVAPQFGEITYSNIMLNLGSAPLPYEPYGYQEGWEVRDNGDRLIWGREDELQTDTGSLQLKGYELPVKIKSILGNSVQNGTPSPSPVNPNLVDPSKTVLGYQQSNGNIHAPSSGNERTTDWIPFTTDTLYAIVSGSNGGNINWVLYDSNKQPLYFYGPTFSPNTVIIISRSGYSAAAFIRISWTNAINQPICVTTEQRSEYIAFDPNPSGPVIPEMCGVRTENLWDEDYTGISTSLKYVPVYVGDADVTMSTTCQRTSGGALVFLLPGNVSSGAATNANGVWATSGSYGEKIRTVSPIDGYVTVAFRTMAESGREFDPTNANSMLNIGSTALPYEPYGWKVQFESHSENLILLPTITAESDGLTVSSSSESMTLFGNITRIYEDNPIWKKFDFTLDAGEYTLSLGKPRAYQNGYAPRLHKYDDGSVLTSYLINPITFTLSEKTHVYMAFYIDDKQLYDDKWVFRLRKGSTVNEVKPIYLGEVPTIRRIKKLVLTGEETWTYESAYTRFYTSFKNTLIIGVRATPAFCTHFQVISDRRQLADVPNDSMYSNSVNSVWFFKKTEYTDVDAWKSYLSAQYNAGTPVTIWYILSEPETEIVNEPLAKIGNYADELTEISVHNLSAPLYGIGDYKDILNLSTGVVTRNIKKLVLDGTESWYKNGNTYLIRLGTIKSLSPGIGLVSTHYPPEGTIANVRQYTSTYWSSTPTPVIGIRDESHASVTDFKAFLDAQYASGSPVIVWYILAEPETETVTVPTGMTGEIEGYLTQVSTPTPTNRSVPKWNGVEESGGTYAVTVYTQPEIPTTTGQNTLTVETEKIHGLTNPLCGIGDYKDVLNLSTGVITRKIKKLVLTGEEEWNTYESLNRFSLSTGLSINNSSGISTHYEYKIVSDGSFKHLYINTTGYLYIFDDDYTTADEFKSFLAAQYQNGTPVTVWYVLNTPETETITVPYGLECSVEGYLTQSGTPTPSNPITPESNGILESDGTYAVEVSLVPSNLVVKGHARRQDITKVHYGFKINKSTENSNNAVSYMYDAATMTPAHMDYEKDEFNYGSWENAFFVKDCYPVALNLDGTEAYKLDPNDYTKKLNGKQSDIQFVPITQKPSDWSTQWKQYYTKDSNDNYNINDQESEPIFEPNTYYKLVYNESFTGNFMMAFPKVWFYRHEDSSYNYVEISNCKLSDDWRCYAHVNMYGEEVDYIYLPLFKGVIKNSKLRSLPGQVPHGNNTAMEEAAAASSLGNRWQLWDHSSMECINDLLILMSKSIDSQTAFGNGVSSPIDFDNTYTYGKLQTGTLVKFGKFKGFSSTRQDVKVFGMEGLWANRFDRIQGMLLVNNVWKIKMTPPYNFTGTDFISLSNAEVPDGSGYVSKMQTSEYGSIPASILNGSQEAFYKDYLFKSDSGIRVAIHGGYCRNGPPCGFRCIGVNFDAYSGPSWATDGVGASPVYK